MFYENAHLVAVGDYGLSVGEGEEKWVEPAEDLQEGRHGRLNAVLLQC